MKTQTPARTKPWMIVAVIVLLGLAFFVADVVLSEPAVTCCAPEA